MTKIAFKIAKTVTKNIVQFWEDYKSPPDHIDVAADIDRHLAPTLALMERLKEKAVMLHDVLTIYNTHKLGEYPEHCDLCAIHTDYEAWKEQG